jgi:hypothetical protein
MAYVVTRLRECLKDPRRRTDASQYAKAKAFPPATEAEVQAAEQMLGFGLPPLLRELYLHVGNGGFGPGAGLLGLPGGATNSRGQSIVELYQELRHAHPESWPATLVPVSDWDCQGYVCVDCSTKEAPALEFHTTSHSLPVDKLTFAERLRPLADSFREWITAWLDSKER